MSGVVKFVMLGFAFILCINFGSVLMFRRYDVNATVAENEVRPDGVQLWIDEAVEEFYSFNDGPSSFVNIKQDIWDNLMQSDAWKERNKENVTTFVQDYLSGDRPIYIPKKISPEVPDELSSPDSEEEMSSTEQKMEIMCNQYFGITRQEYFALEEEAAKRLSGEYPGYIERVTEESKSPSEEKDDKVDKKSKKGWKKWKSRIAKLFKPDKDAKSK